MRQIRAFLIGALVMSVIAVIGGVGTYSAFFSVTSNDGNGAGTGNTVDAGTVDLRDNDLGTAMFTISGMRPADPPVSSCITLTYDGSLTSNVGLYASVNGALAPYLNLTVLAGESSSGFGNCGTFIPSMALYNGSLSAFPTTFGSIMDPNIWTTGTSHSFRFTFSLQNTPAAQGLSSTVTFTWEARNQ
jgi:hypothetical protein